MPDITQEELLEFFRKTTNTCPFCGNTQWGITPAVQPVLTVLSDPSGAIPIPPPNIPGYAAICSGCGFIRVHEAGAVTAKIISGRQNG